MTPLTWLFFTFFFFPPLVCKLGIALRKASKRLGRRKWWSQEEGEGRELPQLGPVRLSLLSQKGKGLPGPHHIRLGVLAGTFWRMSYCSTPSFTLRKGQIPGGVPALSRTLSGPGDLV